MSKEDIEGSSKMFDYMEDEFKASIKDAGLDNVEDQEMLIDLIAYWFFKGLSDH